MKSNFVPSKYQQAVYDEIKKNKSNLLINAVAGSGKSTTIINALSLIPSEKQTIFLAFNKAIVEELKTKVKAGPNVEIKTLHSLGSSACWRNFKSKLNASKYSTYINDSIKEERYDSVLARRENKISKWRENIKKLVDLGRLSLCQYEGCMNQIIEKFEINIIDNEINIATEIIQWGQNVEHEIDFTDMIYFPCIKAMTLPKYDFIFIDECQDLNTAQRTFVLKIRKPTSHFVAVGDPQQAIYGFAGADVESFNTLKSIPNTKELPLSICYRCDTSIVEKAQRLVSQIEARPNADTGTIGNNSSIKDVKNGDLIVCRLTAPLVELCMLYLGKKIKASIKGRDIGQNLINLIEKTGQINIEDMFEDLYLELGNISKRIIAKTHCSPQESFENSLYKSMEDKIEAIDFLSQSCNDTEEIVEKIKSIFSDAETSGIILSTIHKAKGLEAERVFILLPDKLYLPWCMQIPWQAEQEKNLEYVAITRAKHFLGYINSINKEDLK